MNLESRFNAKAQGRKDAEKKELDGVAKLSLVHPLTGAPVKTSWLFPLRLRAFAALR